MSVNTSTLEKMHRIETIYRQGFQSDLIDRAVDKLIELEQSRARRELEEIKRHLETFEQKYRMPSVEFYARYEAGKLDDSAEFMEWGSFCDMLTSTEQYLGWLSGEE